MSSTDAPETRPLWRRLVIPAIAIGLVLLFGVLLSQVFDYEVVWDTIKKLTLAEVAILVALGFCRIATEGLMYQTLLPKLSLYENTKRWLIVNTSTTFVPSPADSVAFYAVAQTQGVEPRRAVTSSLLVFLYPTIGRLILPLVVIVPILIVAAVDDETVTWFLIALAVASVITTAAYFVLRSEATARQLGDFVSSLVNWGLRRFKREPVGGFGAAAVRIRADAIEQVRTGWRHATISVPSNHAVIFLILLLSLRFLGFSNDQLPWIEVLAAYVLAQWLSTIIPLSYAGLGIVDVVLLASLTQAAGGTESEIVAALVMWRLFYWALPLVVGLPAIRIWRRENPHAFEDAKASFDEERKALVGDEGH